VIGIQVAMLAGVLFASLPFLGSALAIVAGSGTPEIDPTMATGGLTALGVGPPLLIELHRARQ
jgi:hypothetical protein